MKSFIQFLTYFRIIASPGIFFFIVVSNDFGLALCIFFLAGISDFWDGYLARKYGHESVLGGILDPIADKILLMFMILALSIHLSSAFIGIIGGLILAREFWVSALRNFNSQNGYPNLMEVTFLAKMKTAVQFTALFIYLLGLFLNNGLLLLIAHLIFFGSMIISLKTGMEYTIKTFNAFN